MSKLRDVEADWRALGIQLGVPKPQLQSIHATHAHLGQTQCMMEMLSFWLSYKPKASWDHIFAALRERVSVFAGLDHWTGLLDWTTGLMNNVILM